MYEHDSSLELPYDTSLNSLLHQQSFKELVSYEVFKQLNLVRKLGNDAAHTKTRITSEDALHSLKILHGFTKWVVYVYSSEPVHVPLFDVRLLPRETPAEIDSKERIKQLEEQYQQSQEIIRKKEEELQRIQAVKEQHAHVPPPVDPNEAKTREIYINLMLREAGWDPAGPNVAEYPVYGMPTDKGEGYADYVLWGDDGKPLGVVEAKRTSRDPRVGSNQAKLYADCLEQMHGQRPVIFYTNGFETYIWDDAKYAPRRIHGFYKKDELELLIQRRSSRISLSDTPVNEDIAGRYYQIAAVRSVTAVLENNGRQALLVMATGSGKTRTAAAIIDLLSKSNWVKRVLFLADRTDLVRQANGSLNAQLPQMTMINLLKDKTNPGVRIVFSTYQTIINFIDQFDDEQRIYGVGHFDLIIFDEIHRSVYNKYRVIFEYFDGFRIGLTATPKDEGDRDTYQLFGLEPNVPTYAYELEQGVADGFLVPPLHVPVPMKFHREGIKYVDLSPEEKLEYEEMFADPVTGDFPDEIQNAAINSWIYNQNTTDQALAYLMQNGIKVAGGDALGKTIIFAKSHNHAVYLVERFNAQYPQCGGSFCQVIDNTVEYRTDLLKNFSEKDKCPQIAVSVDMLDTGIDIPEVVNLVFYKPLRSSAKFWQMIGRGTRLCKDLFGPGQDKEHFYVFDLFENFEFFGKKPKGMTPNSPKSLSENLFNRRLQLILVTQKHSDGVMRNYADELRTCLHKQIESLESESFLVRQHWRTIERFRDKYCWNALTDLEAKDLMDNVASLVFESDTDEGAKRFDLLCLTMELDLLNTGTIREYHQSEVMALATALTRRGSIPMVAQKMQLLKEVSDLPYWESISVPKIETLRTEMRGLIRFSEKGAGRVLYTNFTDELETPAFEPRPVIMPSVDLETYKRRVKEYIQQHKHHIVIHKLRTNIRINIDELHQLEQMLFDQGEIGTREQFIKAYGEQPLGRFIRSIVGLDLHAANEVFSKFINNPSMNVQQIRFVKTIIQYLTTNGVIEAEHLFSPPFTEISSHGLLGVFDNQQAQDLVKLIEEINANTAA